MTSAKQPTPFGRIFRPNEAWLEKRPAEDIVDPDLPIIDTHHHLWDQIRHRYLLPQLLDDLGTCEDGGGHNVVATVYMECGSMCRAQGPEEMRAIGEVEFTAGVAAMCDSGSYGPTRVAAGIVGFADLTLGDRLQPVLEASIRAGAGRFRCVRHAAGWDADPMISNGHHSEGRGLYGQADFRAGLARLTALGLSLDAWLYHPQLTELVDLARACPDANIIMNHCGGALGYGVYTGKRDEAFAQWRLSMSELAQCSNVTMKLGGMMMRLAAFDYFNAPAPPISLELAELWRPNIETCIELFGPERCTFESNFPVEKMGIGYAALWNAFKHLTMGASPGDRDALFSGTARRAYRLA